MARIPMGDFGNVVARPGPTVRADPDAYGAGVGRVVERAGQIGMQDAQQEMDLAAREAKAEAKQQQREAIAEHKQRAREAEAEAKAAAREARRVKALTAQARVSSGVADIGDEIERGLADGSVDKTKAAEIYASRAAKLVEEGTQDVDPEHQELVRATLLSDVDRGRRGVGKLVTQRDKQDILAGGLQYIEEMQRHAMRSPKHAEEAIANVRTFWTATGPMAGENPAQAAQRVQQFAERVRFQQATALVNADPGAAMRALKDPNYLPELDPGQRTNLIHTADVRVTQAANRAEIAAQAHERKMAREWQAATTVLEAGKMLDPAYAAQLQQKFKGTPYAAALGQLMAEGPANAAFVGRPVEMQRRALDEMQGRMNREGATPEMVEAYQKAEKAHKAAVADIKADPYQAAAERGVIRDIAPLTLDLQQLPQQLARRAQDAAQVSQWVGSEVSLLRPHEAEKVAGLLQAMPAKDRAGVLAGLSKTMTPGQMRALGVQLGSKDDTLAAATILAAQGAKTTAGRLAAEILIAGADAMKEDRIKWPVPKVEVRQEIDEITRGAFGNDESAQRAAGDAALAVYAGMLAEGKTPDVKQAVRIATGGIMEKDGHKVVKPYGWTDGMVNKALRDYTDEGKVSALTGGAAVRWGDKELQPAELAKLIPGARLHPSSKPDAYAISIGGRMVIGPNNRPLIVPLER